MLCILAFVIFLLCFPILGFFPEYRQLFARSWQCVVKKATLKPCDINLGEELKNKFLGKIIFKYPKFAKFLDKTFTFWAFIFVVINVWSLVLVSLSGLNLWVYDTCDPVSGESCSLSGEACGVSTGQISLSDAINQNKIGEWAAFPFQTLAQTVSRIPDRFQTWQPTNYLSEHSTFYSGFNFDPTANYLPEQIKEFNQKIALEIIDPGCKFCKELFKNIKQAGFDQKYDLTYLLYPIPDKTTPDGYKFQHSLLRSKYLEAVKNMKPEKQNNEQKNIPADWQLLEKLFTLPGAKQATLQEDFNWMYNEAQAKEKLAELLAEIGFSNEQINEIEQKANSAEIGLRLASQKNIVENEIRTIKIPTVMFGGRRYDRLLSPEQLK